MWRIIEPISLVGLTQCCIIQIIRLLAQNEQEVCKYHHEAKLLSTTLFSASFDANSQRKFVPRSFKLDIKKFCFGTLRPRVVTKSRIIVLFSQHMTRKWSPLVDGAEELKNEVILLTPVEAYWQLKELQQQQNNYAKVDNSVLISSL